MTERGRRVEGGCSADAIPCTRRFMSSRLRPWLLLAIGHVSSFACLACGSTTSELFDPTAASGSSSPTLPKENAAGGPDAGGLSLTAPSGRVALRIERARRTFVNGKLGILQVTVTLANGQGGAAASLDPASFSVQTTPGLLVSGEALTGRSWVPGDSCEPNLALAAGASYTCAIQFVLQGSAVPTSLAYSTRSASAGDPSKPEAPRTASQPLTIEPCSVCGNVCTYTDLDPSNCGACAVDIAKRADVECRAGKVVCVSQGLIRCEGATGTASRCVDVATDSENCGACFRRLPSTERCVAGVASCLPGRARCDGGCVQLSTDNANCGACGVRVPPDQYCKDGVSACETGTPCGNACVDVKTDAQNCGACGLKVPPGGVCVGGVPGCGNAKLCGAVCVDVNTSLENCGTCGRRCPPSQLPFCINGQCL